MSECKIESVRKLDLNPDDILIFGVKGKLTNHGMDMFRKEATKKLEEESIKNKFWVLSDGMTLDIISPKEIKEILNKDDAN